MEEYLTLDEYFDLHPDEEEEFYNETAERSYFDEIIEFEEDW